MYEKVCKAERLLEFSRKKMLRNRTKSAKEYDKDKVGEMVLAPLHLTMFEGRSGLRSWKWRDCTVEVCGSSPHGSTIPMPVTYILQSVASGRYYVGSTSDLDRRLSEHERNHTPSTWHSIRSERGSWFLVLEDHAANSISVHLEGPRVYKGAYPVGQDEM